MFAGCLPNDFLMGSAAVGQALSNGRANQFSQLLAASAQPNSAHQAAAVAATAKAFSNLASSQLNPHLQGPSGSVLVRIRFI